MTAWCESLFLLFCIATVDFGECVRAIVGDPLPFPEPANCLRGQTAWLRRVNGHSQPPVAAREGGVWKPAEEYRDRVVQGSSFAFTRALYTDTGHYELECGSSVTLFQVDVVVASNVSGIEGEELRLPCYITAIKDGTIRWEKKGKPVLELNLSTNEMKYGTGFEGKVSLSSAGRQEGDWSLIFHRAQLGDGGDYFCSNGETEKKSGDPAAVRLQINKRNPDQTSFTPLTPTDSAPEEKDLITIVAITAAVVFGITAPLFSVLTWWLKPCNTQMA